VNPGGFAPHFDNVWAVGKADLNGSLTQPLVEHWNGSAWRIVATPALANVRWSSFSAISAIPGTQQLWAVGSSVPKASNDGHVLIQKWDGTAWNIVKTPTLPQGLIAGSLNGVVALSATNAWAVGWATPQLSLPHGRWRYIGMAYPGR
jgi:hypothetical protein